jgi:hypothetical protein
MAIHGSGDEETAPARALATRWQARSGEPVPLPTIRWPAKGGPFDPPTLTLEEAE